MDVRVTLEFLLEYLDSFHETELKYAFSFKKSHVNQSAAYSPIYIKLQKWLNYGRFLVDPSHFFIFFAFNVNTIIFLLQSLSSLYQCIE